MNHLCVQAVVRAVIYLTSVDVIFVYVCVCIYINTYVCLCVNPCVCICAYIWQLSAALCRYILRHDFQNNWERKSYEFGWNLSREPNTKTGHVRIQLYTRTCQFLKWYKIVFSTGMWCDRVAITFKCSHTSYSRRWRSESPCTNVSWKAARRNLRVIFRFPFFLNHSRTEHTRTHVRISRGRLQEEI